MMMIDKDMLYRYKEKLKKYKEIYLLWGEREM